jgi:hypothetical protein
MIIVDHLLQLMIQLQPEFSPAYYSAVLIRISRKRTGIIPLVVNLIIDEVFDNIDSLGEFI